MLHQLFKNKMQIHKFGIMTNGISKMANPEHISICGLNKDVLKNKKLVELRNIAKMRGLRVGGKKQELIDRIYELVKTEQSAIKVQKIFRRYLVQLWMKLKWKSKQPWKNKIQPVNDSDFYTLEPIEEIEPIDYYCYIGKTNTSYVFNITSLFQLLLKTNKIENPYTREDMFYCYHTLVRIMGLNYILFPKKTYQQLQLLKLLPIENTENIYVRTAYPVSEDFNFETEAVDLCVKLDLLGNYTNVDWLTNLTENDMRNFIFSLQRLWLCVPIDTRKRICPRYGPFSIKNLGLRNISDNTHLETIKSIVIFIGNLMVSSGVDEEHKKLGAMYFLCGLTICSENAREQLPWLNDAYYQLLQQNM